MIAMYDTITLGQLSQNGFRFFKILFIHLPAGISFTLG